MRDIPRLLAVTALVVLAASCENSDDAGILADFVEVNRTPAPNQVFLALDSVENERVSVSVRVRGTGNLYGADLTLVYDPTRVVFRTYDPGTLLEQGAGFIDYQVQAQIPGTLRIQIARATAGTVVAGLDDPRLVTLGVDVVKTGSAPTGFGGSLHDDASNPLPGITFFGGSFQGS